MADKSQTPTPTPADTPATITLGLDELNALVQREVAAALAARAPAAAPQTIVVSGDEAALARTREQAKFRFLAGVGWTNVPEGHDPITGRPR